jgi:hypothetical protein
MPAQFQFWLLRIKELVSSGWFLKPELLSCHTWLLLCSTVPESLGSQSLYFFLLLSCLDYATCLKQYWSCCLVLFWLELSFNTWNFIKFINMLLSILVVSRSSISNLEESCWRHYLFLVILFCGAGACLKRVLLAMEAVVNLSIWLGVR